LGATEGVLRGSHALDIVRLLVVAQSSGHVPHGVIGALQGLIHPAELQLSRRELGGFLSCLSRLQSLPGTV
jgi:hypothetical protein